MTKFTPPPALPTDEDLHRWADDGGPIADRPTAPPAGPSADPLRAALVQLGHAADDAQYGFPSLAASLDNLPALLEASQLPAEVLARLARLARALEGLRSRPA